MYNICALRSSNVAVKKNTRVKAKLDVIMVKVVLNLIHDFT